MWGCKSITSPDVATSGDLPFKGSTSLPTINGTKVDLSAFTFKKKSHKDSNTIASSDIDKEALTKFANELSTSLESEYIAVFGILDSVGQVFDYSYAKLEFDEDLLFDNPDSKELFIYAIGDEENGVQKIAFALIPKATEAKETFLNWVFPRYKGKIIYPNFDLSNSPKPMNIDCEWVQTVPAGYIYFGDGSGAAKYFPPELDYQCTYVGGEGTFPDYDTNGGGGVAINLWDDLNGDDNERIHVIAFKQVPCPGNPIKSPRIAPQKNSGINGGRFGDTRSGGEQYHGGLDILNEYGSPIFAPYNGTIASVGYSAKLGNYITMQFLHTDGSYYTMQFGHLQNTDDLLKGAVVKAGDIIGKQGNSGNLAGAIEKGLCESHSHIITKKRTTNSWDISKYTIVNPEEVLKTKFNTNGTVTSETDC